MKPSAYRHFFEQFHNWERLGRGNLPLADCPIAPEPPFFPFPGYERPKPTFVDDGSRPTFLTRAVDAFRLPAPAKREEPGDLELDFDFLERESIREVSVTLPAGFSPRPASASALLRQLSQCSEAIALEIFGERGLVRMQFAASACDAEFLLSVLRGYFPDAVFQFEADVLHSAFLRTDPQKIGTLDCALGREFFFPLAAAEVDVFVGLMGALAGLRDGQFGLYQVLFQSISRPWSENILASVTDQRAQAYPWVAKDLLEAAAKKASQPLHAVIIRFLSGGGDAGEVWRVMARLVSALHLFANPSGNHFIPLNHRDEYPRESHLEDILLRQSHRFGMILTHQELVGLVHLPGAEVNAPAFKRLTGRTKAAPEPVSTPTSLCLGQNVHQGEIRQVYLNGDQRVRHMHVIGAPGYGKSNLLFEMLCQDLESGQGLALFDPHGDLVNLILSTIPDERVEDVIVFDPCDKLYAPSFNVLSAHSDLERTVLASDLVSVFQEHSLSWGPQMGIIFNNAILAFLSSSREGTLTDLVEFLVDDRYRARFLETVGDPRVRFYWQSVFSAKKSAVSVTAIVGRLSEFLTPRAIADIVDQRRSTLDFAEIMNSGKVFLARLPLGLFGEGNGHLLAGLLLAKFLQAAMGRQMMAEEDRRDFWIYLDECHEFLSPSVHKILTGTRKYRTGLILAHQNLGQVEGKRETYSAMRNANVKLVFNLDESDARNLARGFRSFESGDIQSLDKGEAICVVERPDHDFNLQVPFRPRLPPEERQAKRELVEASSRARYCRARSEIQDDWMRRFEPSVRLGKEKAAGSEETLKPESGERTPEPAKEWTEPPGRGGPEHDVCVKAIKRLAGEYQCGWRVEEKVPGTKYGIDIVVEGDLGAIAFEVWISNEPNYEVHNVLKCVGAGYQRIVTVCRGKKRVSKIREALEGHQIPEGVEILQLDFATEQERLRELIRQVSGLKTPPPIPRPEVRIVGAHEIASKFTDYSPEAKAIEAEAVELIRRILREPPPGK